MRILIVGEGKSGTTALLRSVSSAFGDPDEVFEPADISTLDDNGPVVVKKLLHTWTDAETEVLDRFDKRIYIVRDVRDRLISHLLYDAYNRGPYMEADKQQQWLSLLERKADDPTQISFTRLLDVWWRLSGTDLMTTTFRIMSRGMAFNRLVGERFETIHYEDYVDGRVDALEAYLERSVKPGELRPDEHRVRRSKGHGAWRHWFVKGDVRTFRAMMSRPMIAHGYDHRDWTLAAQPTVERATSADYVRRLFANPGPINPESS